MPKPPARSAAKQKARSAPTRDEHFPIIAIGASAGGLEPFLSLLRNVPEDSRLAIIYLQHSDVSHISELPQILARVTKIPVRLAVDTTRIDPNAIYVAPPDGVVTFSNGVLRVEPRGDRAVMPIDALLRSLAVDQGSRAISVILSGTASDGTLGSKAIKAEGGITFAQDDSARFDGMPRSAIAAGAIDFVLPPPEIADEIVRIARHSYLAHDGDGDHFDDHDLTRVFTILRAAHDVDFTYYKPPTIERRIRRRMALQKVETLSDYIRILREKPEEVEQLYGDILIRVTSFFRDPEVFTALQQKIVPELIRQHGDRPVRIWVPGCATGEEVYSLAIVFHEALAALDVECPVQVFGTDVSDASVERARSGLYTESIAAEVSPERLRRFFTKVEGGYRVAKSIRDCCIFARQNLTRDPPFSKVDLISCRNVLIYLGAVLQRRVMTIFHYALQPHGYLLLGNSETIGNYSDTFSVADRRNKIYQRKGAGGRLPIDLTKAVIPINAAHQEAFRGSEDDPGAPSVFREADRVLLARFSPAGVVIDDNMEILQFRGRTSAFLEPAPGTASFNLLKMVREGLLAELRTAIHAARKKDTAVRREKIPVTTDGRMQFVNVDVIPFVGPHGAKHYIVLFDAAADESGDGRKRRGKAAAAQPADTKQSIRLKRELEATRDYLQSIIEEQEAMNEELRSANEEIQSSNEELQSTNEELETAKEELQSSNEELMTVNEELEHRNDELAQANNDLLNLLASVDLPIVMLDSGLRIRRFNPGAQRTLNLISSDAGRSISDLKLTLEVNDLDTMIAQVIDTLETRELQVRDRNGRNYLLRIRPYKTADNKIDGAVLVLIDIDQLKKA